MEDSLDQAFEIVAGVEDYLSKNVLPKARKNSHHNCDSLFQEAESLLLKGLPKVNVLDKLCKETLAKYPPLLFSSQADVESEGENVIPEYSVDINESSIPVDNVNSTDETEKNESQSPALPSCHILSEPKNKQRKMQDEDPASKTNSKSKDGNTDVKLRDDEIHEEAEELLQHLPFSTYDAVSSAVKNWYHDSNRKYAVMSILIAEAAFKGKEIPQSTYKALKNLAPKKRDLTHVEDVEEQPDFGVEERVLFKEENIDMEEDAPPEVPANIDEIHPEDIGADEEQVTVEDPQLNDGAAGVLDDVQRQNWIEEKTALVASIIETVPVCTIAERVRLCFSDVDIEQVIDSLLNSASPAPEVNAADRVQRDEAVAGPSGWSAFRTVKNGDRASAASTSTEGSMPGLKEFIPSRPGGALHLSDDEVTSSVDEAGPSTSGSNKEAASHDDEQEDEEWVESHSRTLREMFPDADPEYLATRKKRREMRKKFLDGMTVPEFLELFEEPEKLLNDLPFHLSKEVDHVLNANNYHYLPSLRQLKLYEKCGRRKTKRKETPISGELEDFFLKELCYARLEESIERHRAAQEEAKKEAFAAAKVAGLLCTCPICCEDEILEEDMRACASLDSPHLFCKTCVRRYCEEQIGQGSLKFTCLEGSCKEEFSLNVLKTVLKSSVFSNLLKRKQAEEIVAAGIADLECCPFCNFATIMPNKEDKIFNCLNPECLKDTCRLCKELSHIPLRCEEVETKSQLSARTYLENQMSEAMVRECYKCGQRFIKEDGCNKMVCSCGAVMCYLCKKPIRGYDHFTDQGRAAAGGLTPSENGNNSLKLHAEEVQKRAAEAKKTLDPDVQLKHDPTKDVPQVPDFLQNPHPYVVVPPPQRAHRPPDAPVNIVARPLRAGNAFQLGVEGRRHMHEPFGPWGPHYNLIADDAAVFGDLLVWRALCL
ncbi:hypothetical protein HAZT_HAZT000521 [Hyalella azteca]|uniref:RING-type domain-containing protein n=1 Tax=Hyalella azteca TaxID=294128 RepID=A0A6A0GTB2_HYAAZ|nr:hypothetical protein HAZT_HAZT000521 [Hyalella azteca]